MIEVELRPAYVWDCPSCGVEQFHRGLVPEMDEEEERELRERLGIEPWDTGCWTMMPKNVKCTECGKEYLTLGYGTHLNEDDVDDDEE